MPNRWFITENHMVIAGKTCEREVAKNNWTQATDLVLDTSHTTTRSPQQKVRRWAVIVSRMGVRSYSKRSGMVVGLWTGRA